MKALIQEKLALIEEKYEVKILFACETGSRAWGFPSPDSDYDVRFVYVHHMEHYLSITENEGDIQFFSENKMLDFSGWDIKKFLKLTAKSNMSVFERLQSPIMYKNSNNTTQYLLNKVTPFFNPSAGLYHYLGLAKNSFFSIKNEENVKLKTLFYALRACLASNWIMDGYGIPPMILKEKYKVLNSYPEILKLSNELIELKSTKNEDYFHPSPKVITDYIENTVNNAENYLGKLGGSRGTINDLNGVFVELLKVNK